MKTFVLLAALSLPAFGAELQPYISAQAGAVTLSGTGTTTHQAQDVNPRGTPYHVSDGAGIARLALGARYGFLGLELGYMPRAGSYHRSLEWSADVNPEDDLVGEIVDTSALDLRAVLYTPQWGRWSAYGFASVVRTSYTRSVWTGHALVDGHEVPTWDLDNPASAWDKWIKTSGAAIGYGAGAGIAFNITKRLALTAEYSATFEQFETRAAMAGLRWGF